MHGEVMERNDAAPESKPSVCWKGRFGLCFYIYKVRKEYDGLDTRVSGAICSIRFLFYRKVFY